MKFLPIDVELMRSMLAYDPSVGGSCLVWKVNIDSNNGGIQKRLGKRAGHVNKDGYCKVLVQGVGYWAHRLVWAIVYGEDPQCQIDHIDGHMKGNHVENLRLAPRNELDNCQNRKVRRDSFTGHTGVSFRHDRNKYRARITLNGKQNNLGDFDTLNEALAAYTKAKAELHSFSPKTRD